MWSTSFISMHSISCHPRFKRNAVLCSLQMRKSNDVYTIKQWNVNNLLWNHKHFNTENEKKTDRNSMISINGSCLLLSFWINSCYYHVKLSTNNSIAIGDTVNRMDTSQSVVIHSYIIHSKCSLLIIMFHWWIVYIEVQLIVSYDCNYQARDRSKYNTLVCWHAITFFSKSNWTEGVFNWTFLFVFIN